MDAFSSFGADSTAPSNGTPEGALGDSSKSDRNDNVARSNGGNCTGSNIYNHGDLPDVPKEDDDDRSCQCCLGWTAARCFRQSGWQRSPFVPEEEHAVFAQA
mmetsp:Transcript_46490/g.140853  ORF Transcript_46490/g.140853 Transcript_46490/m.140853 type:complete len:102 (-) Transcript_46490:359-664(-)